LKSLATGGNCEAGEVKVDWPAIARKGISKVVFVVVTFTMVVKALAEAAREAGLDFKGSGSARRIKCEI